MVLMANQKDGLSTCALRVSNPFGPGDDNLVPFLVQGAKEGWAKVSNSFSSLKFYVRFIEIIELFVCFL